jgi:hypothetical protein
MNGEGFQVCQFFPETKKSAAFAADLMLLVTSPGFKPGTF